MNADPLVLYRSSVARFDELVGTVKDDQWTAATPCTEWDVRALVQHIVGENRWLPKLLAGLTIAEVGTQLDGDLLGDDPVRAWRDATDAAAEAVAQPGALARTVHLSFGDTDATEYLWQVAADHVVHGWDLAVALGADDRIDRATVDAVAAWFAGNEGGYRSAGAVALRPDLDAEAGAQAHLLAMFGRHRPEPDPIVVVDQFGAAFDAQDVDAIMAMMTDDCVFESTPAPDGGRFEGQAAVRAAWSEFFAGSEGTEFVTESRFACGARVVVQWRYSWTGATPGHVRGVDLFTVRDGLVAVKASYVKG
ncbi:hypothetical protein acdb102_05510 [Acidothermaceae bacterium B102]|nr:hypothetical protein acdb102_05510 [Acidothermaceae bacterium B102]